MSMNQEEFDFMREAFKIQPQVFGLFKIIQHATGARYNSKIFDNIPGLKKRIEYFVAYHQDNVITVRLDSCYSERCDI